MSEKSGGSPVFFTAWVKKIKCGDVITEMVIEMDTQDLLKVVFVDDQDEVCVNLKEAP